MSATAPALPRGDRVALFRDDSGDAPAVELAADRAGRVSLVGDHRIRAGAGPAAQSWAEHSLTCGPT